MSHDKPEDLDPVAIAKFRIHIAISTICVIALLATFMILILTKINDTQLMVLIVSLGFCGIWTLVVGILLQVAMRVKKPVIIFTAIAAYVLPWITGVVLFTQATLKLKHIRCHG